MLNVKDANGNWIDIPALVGVSITGVAIDANEHLIISLSNGSTLDAGALPKAEGEKGDTPVKGTDYFTPAEIAEIEQSVLKSLTTHEWNDFAVNTAAAELPDENAAVYTKINGIVSLQGAIRLISALESGTALTVGTLPEGFRPKNNVYTMRNLGGSWYRVGVLTDGSVTATHWNSASLSNSYSYFLNIEFAAA